MVAIYDVLKASKGIHVDDTFAELWGRKLSNAYTVATYTGTLPATLQTVEGYLESYKIYGNTEQTGTPTPDNPIVPSGCGERTANLWNEVFPAPSENTNKYIPIYVGDGDFTFSTNGGLYNSKYAMYMFMAGRVTSGGSTANNGVSAGHPRAVTAINGYVTIVYHGYSDDYSPENFWGMLNTGSSPLPYEPYGYKLPILSNSTVTNIYLGEVETTRQIKKLVLTGEESYYLQSINAYGIANFYLYIATRTQYAICTHLKRQTTIISQTTDEGYLITVSVQSSSNASFYMRINSSIASSVAELKTFLAAQYAAGTPVTVWYVLAEPEIAVVNEPLMKIGDYADTIDSTQTSAQIPTAARETTISWAGEGLAPSEVELTYRKPKGQ